MLTVEEIDYNADIGGNDEYEDNGNGEPIATSETNPLPMDAPTKEKINNGETESHPRSNVPGITLFNDAINNRSSPISSSSVSTPSSTAMNTQ
jgi:hypothetical protein